MAAPDGPEGDEAVRTRAPNPQPVRRKPFSKAHPSFRSLLIIPGPSTGLSDAVERRDRNKPDTIAPEHVEKLLADMDEENNGVRATKLYSLRSPASLANHSPAYPHAAFARAPGTPAQYVERASFRRYVKRMGWPLPEDKIDAMFDEADNDGDGRLNYFELQAAASGRFKQRIHKHDWFNFLSTVAEMLSGTQNVFELPIDPPMQVEVQDGADMAPEILTYRPRRFGGDVPSERSPGARQPQMDAAGGGGNWGKPGQALAPRERLFVVPPKASAKPNTAVAIAPLDSFAPVAGAMGLRTIGEAEEARAQQQQPHQPHRSRGARAVHGSAQRQREGCASQ